MTEAEQDGVGSEEARAAQGERRATALRARREWVGWGIGETGERAEVRE